MLYRFKSKNMGDVIMLEPNGRQVLEIIGKTPSPRGIILPEQMPAAIEALEAAIRLEESKDEKDGDGLPEGVGLHQHLGRQRQHTAQRIKRQPGVAQRAADINIVAGLGA